MSWHPDQSRAFLGYHVRDPDQHCPGSLPVPTVRMFCSYVAFPFEPNLDEIAQFYEDDRNLFVGSLADCLPPPDVITKTHPANYASTKFDFSSLVDLRSAHEMRQVKNYSRTPQINTPESASQKQEILRAFNAVLRRNKEQRLGSGLHRQQQYGSSPGTAGDSVSAELAATVRASKVRFTPVCSLRNVFALAHFKAAKVRHKGFSRVVLPKPHGGILKDAGVTHLRVLRCLENPSGPFNESIWAFVSVAKKIYIARGMSRHTDELDCSHMDCIVDSPRAFFFQKGGGENGRHGWILSTANIHGLSNIGVQLFEHAHLHLFRAVHEADFQLQTRCHNLIPARQLLTFLQKTPSPLGGDIEISEDRTVYRLLEKKTCEIELALKYMNSRKVGECVDTDSEVVEQK